MVNHDDKIYTKHRHANTGTGTDPETERQTHNGNTLTHEVCILLSRKVGDGRKTLIA